MTWLKLIGRGLRWLVMTPAGRAALLTTVVVLSFHLYGRQQYRRGVAAGVAAMQAETIKRIAKANKRADAIDAQLQKALNKPKAGARIREIVREHPVDCAVPEPVADGLRDAIRTANEAAR